MGLKCLVFDFDGTIVQSNDIKRRTFFEIAADYEDGEERIGAILFDMPHLDRAGIFKEFSKSR